MQVFSSIDLEPIEDVNAFEQEFKAFVGRL